MTPKTGRMHRRLGPLIAGVACGVALVVWLGPRHGAPHAPGSRVAAAGTTAGDPRLPERMTAATLHLRPGTLCPSSVRLPTLPAGSTVTGTADNEVAFGDFWEGAIWQTGNWRFQIAGPGIHATGLEDDLMALAGSAPLPGTGVFSLVGTRTGEVLTAAWQTGPGCESVRSARSPHVPVELALLFVLREARAG